MLLFSLCIASDPSLLNGNGSRQVLVLCRHVCLCRFLLLFCGVTCLNGYMKEMVVALILKLVELIKVNISALEINTQPDVMKETNLAIIALLFQGNYNNLRWGE